MADQIEQIVTALTGCCAECADRAEHIAWAIHEHAPAGLLADPASDAEVRADERAKVLAGFTEVYTLAWDGEPSMSGAPHRCSTAAEFDLATARQVLDTVGRRKPNPRIERRLVSLWEPTP